MLCYSNGTDKNISTGDEVRLMSKIKMFFFLGHDVASTNNDIVCIGISVKSLYKR